MRSIRHISLAVWVAVALAVVALACSSPRDDGPDVAGIRALLLARHSKDLPDRAVLDRHPGAADALAEIARTDRRLIVRARALQLLGLYPTPATAELLTGVIADPGAPAKLRAAAVFGLGRFDLGASASLRATVVAALREGDVRVSAAAVATLRKVPVAAPELARAAADPTVPRAVRERIERAR